MIGLTFPQTDVKLPPPLKARRALSKTCYFHLGFHKTASTYIQAAIEMNRNGVLERFHVVNRAAQDTRPLKIALVGYGQKNTPETRAAAEAECDRVVEQFEASGKNSLLLSEEVLLGPMLRQSGEMGLYSTLEPKMAVLLDRFSAYELHFLFYTRDTAAWLRSLYNQAVKQVRFAGSYDAFLDGIDTTDVWGTLLRRIRGAAEGKEVVFFDLADDKGSQLGTGDSLFRHIGLTDDELAAMIKPKGPVNSSWPEPCLGFMRALNASEIDNRSLAIVRDVMKRNLRLFTS